MPPGCWLSLVPTTDHGPGPTTAATARDTTTSTSSSTQMGGTSGAWTSSSSPPQAHTLKQAKSRHHNHDHHPSPNSFLKPMVLESHHRRTKKNGTPTSSSSSCTYNSQVHILPLLENQNVSHHASSHSHPHSTRSGFEIRPLQLADIEKVKELHCATLPVTYPSSFFYSLLGSHPPETISLVATLPSSTSSAHGYFDMPSSHPPSPFLSNHHPHAHLVAHHHHHHHVTSPLSGRKPISLDVVGSITARVCPDQQDQQPHGAVVRILTLCVSPAYRRAGVGRLLLTHLLTQIKARFSTKIAPQLQLAAPDHPSSPQRRVLINLHVQATNRVACTFYQSAGFIPICFKSDYYSNDDLKPLDPSLKLSPSPPSLPSSRPKTPPHQPQSSAKPYIPPLQSDSHATHDSDAWLLELAVDCS
ncbi:hypothetical protein PCANC_17936 [Puccinia coronata f. sp. avenae]|uniref:N-alpha-acetyltransferase 60 n=1 Tax=Puccinia coronata f. sp. avenae TaxID=200324 RepID=A0A2N5SQB1_9BASI|nr:hypothetical protein PCANC_17936 [Puccinia coronata f. sp. avenae]